MKVNERRLTAIIGSLFSSLGGQAALAVSGPLTARLLGVTGRGQLAVILLCVGITSLLGGIGLPTSVAFFLAKWQATTAGSLWRFRRAWLLLCLTAAVGCVLAVVLYSEFAGRLGPLPIISSLAGLAVVLTMTQQLTIGCFQGEMRFSQLSVLRALPAVLTAAAIAFLYETSSPHSVQALLTASVGGLLVSTSISVAVLLRNDRQGPADASPFTGRNLTRYGLRALLGSSSPMDTLSLDQAFVGLLLAPRMLGFYVVAGSFANLTTLVLQSVGLIALPRVAANIGAEQQRREIRMLIIGSVAFGALTCAGIELFLRPALTFAFGREFLPALTSARILVVGGFFLGMRRLLTSLLQALGRPGRASFAEGLGVATLLVLLPPGILMLHESGAALSISLSALVTSLYLAQALRKESAFHSKNMTVRKVSNVSR